jgi:hypothetical protein
MLECWTIGGQARSVAPPEWVALTQGMDPEAAERALLTLAGQFGMVGLMPAKPPDTRPTRPLPVLDAPTIPERLRPVLRTALAQGDAPEAIIRMVARRGFVVHPADWFPKATPGRVPEVYQPWIDWRNRGTQAPVKPRPKRQDQPGHADDAAELAEFFKVSVKRGLRKKKTTVTAKALASPAQGRARSLLFQRLTLAQLAAALELEPDALVAAWDTDQEDKADQEFAQMVARTGSAAHAHTLALSFALTEDSAANVETMAAVCDADLIDAPDASRIKLDAESPQPRHIAAIATLASPEAATGLLERLESEGAPRMLPALSPLVLNAGLGADLAHGIVQIPIRPTEGRTEP